MSSASGVNLAVSSWGYLDDDGRPCTRAKSIYCLWSVMQAGVRIGFVALPMPLGATDALVAAESGMAEV